MSRVACLALCGSVLWVSCASSGPGTFTVGGDEEPSGGMGGGGTTDRDGGERTPPEPDKGDAGGAPVGVADASRPDPNVPSGFGGGGSGLVAYFGSADGLFLVEETGIHFHGWDGETRSWTSERLIQTAAFDGTLIVVADAANMVTLDTDFQQVTEVGLVEACEFGVMVSGERFVCGPSNDWDRVFYTYDARTGDLLATSGTYTYNGIPMRRVPGQDYFICVSGGSPSDLHLYEVADTHEARYIGESPYHGDFPVTPEYGFAFDPVTHVVTAEGLMLRITSADCDPAMNSFTSGCFLKDGNLGTLPGTSARYLASEGRGDEGFALIDAGGGSSTFDAQYCHDEQCILQRIDLTTKDVLAEQLIRLGAEMRAFYLVPGPAPDEVVVIASGRSIYRSSTSDSLQYEFSLFRP